MSDKTCANRIDSAWESTKEDLEAYMNMVSPSMGDDERGPFNEYALSFDYVAPHTFPGQTEGYWRYQMSYGGPSDEIRFFGDDPDNFDRAEYWFLDWFDGARIDVSGDACVMWLWNEMADTGSTKHAYDEAMKDYEPPEPKMRNVVTAFAIEIDTENAAFEGDDLGSELARILRKLADKVDGLDHDDVIDLDCEDFRDINGNKVGYIDVTHEEQEDDSE